MPPRPMRTRAFSILNMEDDYKEAFDTLYKAMADQNPDIDADAFDMQLRRMVASFGKSGGLGDNFAAFASMAEEQPVATIYNASGDHLSIAHHFYRNGDKRKAVEFFEAAMEEEDAFTLIDAIQVNNKRSAIGLQSSDEDTDNTKSDKSDENEDENNDDQNEIVELQNDDNDQSDNLDNATGDDEVEIAKASMSQLLQSIHAGEKSSEDTDEEPLAKKPMALPKEDKKSSDEEKPEDKTVINATIRAASNRLSLDGSRDSRAKATLFRKKAVKNL